jgi:hypothetical protein
MNRQNYDPDNQTPWAAVARRAKMCGYAMDKAVVHAMPCRSGTAFAMMAFVYEPTFSVHPLELVTGDSREPLDGHRSLRTCGGPDFFAEIPPGQPLRNIRDAFDLALAWIKVHVEGQAYRPN